MTEDKQDAQNLFGGLTVEPQHIVKEFRLPTKEEFLRAIEIDAEKYWNEPPVIFVSRQQREDLVEAFGKERQ